MLISMLATTVGLAIVSSLSSSRQHCSSNRQEAFGVLTGAGGIRGVRSFQSFTPEQIAAYNREGAAQGLRSVSVAPM